MLSRLCDGNTGTAGVLARATRVAQGEFEAGGAAELKPAVDAARGVAREMAVARALDAEAALPEPPAMDSEELRRVLEGLARDLGGGAA